MVAGRGARPARLAALTVYVASAAWVLRGSLGRAVGAGVDLPGTLWYHGFVADCVAAGRLPGHTDAFFAPDGKDIFADTGANVLDALLAAPFLAVLGAPAHMAPFVATLLVGNALAMHALLRTLGAGTAATVAGSVAYAFGPAVLHELDGGRPTQALLWFWPLAVRELVRMREAPGWGHPVRAGVLVALQAWTYWFTGHFFAVVLGPALVAWGIFGAPMEGASGGGFARVAAARPYLLRLVGAGGVALLAVAPAVVPMLARLWSQDLLDGGALTHAAKDLDPDAWWILAPWASGLRVPTWFLAILGAGLLFGRRRVLWGVAATLGVLLVAGSRLAIADGSLPNPVWAMASLLPGFERLLFPARAWPLLGLVGAAALGEALGRLRGPAGVLAAGGVVLAVHAAHPAPVNSTEASAPAYVDAVARAPGTVLNLPYPCGQLVIHHQPLHGQPMFGGMAEHIAALRPPGVDARIAASPALRGLLAAAVGEGSGQPRGAGGLDVDGIRWVVLHTEVYTDPLAGICLRGERGPGLADRARGELARLLGPPTVADERATAWDLEAR